MTGPAAADLPPGRGRVMTRPGRPRVLPSLSWVALCIAVSGVLTFGYLALVARALREAEYGWFGAYWSLTLVVAFGAFLPIELELARLARPRTGGGRVPAGTGPAVLAVTTVSLAAVFACWPLLTRALGGDAGLLVALAVNCLVSGPQFVLRGLLLGRGAYRWYGVTLLLDSGVRLAAAAALASSLPSPSAGDFGWTLPVAVVLAHGPLLIVLLRRPADADSPAAGNPPAPDPAPAVPDPPRPPGEQADPPGQRSPRSDLLRAVGHLLVGCLCAQALLNAAPVLVTGAAGPAEEVLAAQFVAGFTLVRIPLFVAVPLQSALVGPLAALDRNGDERTRRGLLGWLLAGTGALSVAAALVGLLAGPALVSALFGARYALPGPQIAVLAAGTAVHVGLLVTAQALLAAGRHRDTAVAWAAGLLTAVGIFAVVPDLVTRASLAFAVGSAAGLLVSSLLLLRRRASPSDALVAAAGRGGRV